MKKTLYFALFISMGFNFYLLNSKIEVANNFEEETTLKKYQNRPVQDRVDIAQSSVAKSLPAKSNNCECSSTKSSDSVNLEPEVPQKAYDEKAVAKKLKNLKLKWEKDSRNFFYNDLLLRDDQIERYNELVKMRKLEADDYFEPKIKNAQVADQENGGLPYYIHTTEDTVFMGKLAERYDSLLHENFGDQAFSDYKKFINKHNKETIKEDVFFPIEF